MIVCTVIYGTLWFFGGGILIAVGLVAYIGGPAGYFGWFGKVSARLKKKAALQVAQAASKDPAWDMDALNNHVQKTFMAFQQDWSTFNAERIKTYLSPAYSYHVQLMLAAIKLRQRRNTVDNPQLIEAYPVTVEDFENNSQDAVTFYIHGKANDKLIEQINEQETLLFEDDNDFIEYWRFVRSDNTWRLDGISQQTQNQYMLRAPISQFALQNGMYYSPDWGWLLLPRRGQLFSGGQFGISDINNHVIGVYKNVLVELYTYLPASKTSSSNASQYLIAQAALPKRYDSLIVQAKESSLMNLFGHTPKGYNKLSLEWPDFNKRYNVYATNIEQVTAFELLHPVYMEKLFALPFKVSIEVVDNVVYLYAKDMKADYPTMYSILKDAFEEMKL